MKLKNGIVHRCKYGFLMVDFGRPYIGDHLNREAIHEDCRSKYHPVSCQYESIIRDIIKPLLEDDEILYGEEIENGFRLYLGNGYALQMSDEGSEFIKLKEIRKPLPGISFRD